MFWCSLQFLGNLIFAYIAFRHQNNHFISYVGILLMAPAILWALSLWQSRPVARLTIRLTIPAFVVAWTLLTLLVEDITNFSPVAEPIYSMLALGAAVYTLLSRGLTENEPLLRQDWFWVCAGMCLYFVPLIVVEPLSAAYVRTNPALVMDVYTVRFYINTAAFIAVTIGMLCPRTTQSGRFSSPRSAA